MHKIHEIRDSRTSERDFQQQIVDLAQLLGWRVYHPFYSMRSAAGWPDLALARPGRLILAELKSDRGRLTEPQREWLELLSSVDGLEVYCWRPADFGEIVQTLRSE